MYPLGRFGWIYCGCGAVLRPLYTVVLLSENRARLCDKLSLVLKRRFSLGTRSFLLKPHEAAKLMLTSLSSRGTEAASAIGRDS